MKRELRVGGTMKSMKSELRVGDTMKSMKRELRVGDTMKSMKSELRVGGTMRLSLVPTLCLASSLLTSCGQSSSHTPSLPQVTFVSWHLHRSPVG